MKKGEEERKGGMESLREREQFRGSGSGHGAGPAHDSPVMVPIQEGKSISLLSILHFLLILQYHSSFLSFQVPAMLRRHLYPISILPCSSMARPPQDRPSRAGKAAIKNKTKKTSDEDIFLANRLVNYRAPQSKAAMGES